MRRFILPASLILLFILLILFGAGYALAENGPIGTGSALYNLQDFAEQQRARLTQSPTERAAYQLRLLERRTGDLAASVGTNGEAAALQALDRSLDQGVLALSAAPSEGLEALKTHLAEILVKLQASLAAMQAEPVGQTETYLQVVTRAAALHNMVAAFTPGSAFASLGDTLPPQTDGAANTSLQQTPTSSAIAQPQAVAFPPGSPGAEHKFFPLYGKHATLTCQGCHVDGVYAGTPKLCVDCHEDVLPAEHYPGDCAICHLSTTWKEVQFDHITAKATDCQTCHYQVKPANHYNGQCSACHAVKAWKPATFNHQVARATNCQNCHFEDSPANHYSAQCSACHNTRAWLPARFNHAAAGATNCQNCHSDDRPSDHYSGQCSACHSTNTWSGAKFNHSGQANCSSCHNPPSNHFSGQCSTCHNTNTFKGAKFSHQGLTNCSSCHNPPSGHFSGQCSNCHTTTSFQGAKFTHQGLNDCSSCHTPPGGHYSGQCSNCHNTNGWGGAKFSHNGLNDCKSCHSGDAPGGHWGGQCSSCHNTGGWSDVNVNGHGFPMDHGGADGECSACHEGTSSNVNCSRCHDKGETEKRHTDKGILDIGGRCLECHPDGKGD